MSTQPLSFDRVARSPLGFLTLAVVCATTCAALVVAPHHAAAFAHGETARSGALGAPSGTHDARSVGLDEGSGAATLSIPVDLPPGPNDLVPELALSYSSQAGNGPLGVGWSIASPAIVCASRFGVPDYAACDRFEMNGEVLVGPDEDGAYHAFEESFVRIERHAASGTWTATSTRGTTMTFGEGGGTASRVFGPGGIAEWHLSSVTDVFGNRVDFTYTSGPAGDEGHLHPETIRYADGTRLVSFHYAPRSDVLSSYQGGVRRVQSQLLEEVRVEVGGALHHRLWLEYETSSASGLSRLVSVQRFGQDCGISGPPAPGSGCSALPAATFDYAETGDLTPQERWTSQGIPADENPWFAPTQLANEQIFIRNESAQFADVNGDGLVDMLTDLPRSSASPLFLGSGGSGVAGLDPVVRINDGVGGWTDPVWSGNGGAALNASARWTDALRALRFDLPAHRVKMARSSFDPEARVDAEGNPHPQRPEVLFGTCRDAGESDVDQAVEWYEDGASIQFAGTGLFDPAPYFEASINRNFPSAADMLELCGDDWDEALLGPCYEPQDLPLPTQLRPENWSEVAVSEIRPWPQFQMVDLNADGRADLVMSIHLSGFNLSLDDCQSAQMRPLGAEGWVEGATVRVVFLNTGDPDIDGGWLLDDGRDAADGNFADSLPPFGIVSFEASDLAFREIGRVQGFVFEEPGGLSQTNNSPCDDYGLAGMRSYWDQTSSRSYDFCVAAYDLAPVFHDFDGDGHVDIMVTRTADRDALFHNFVERLEGENVPIPVAWRSSPSIESVVYLQNPEAAAGEDRWVRAEAYDPPYDHAFVLQVDGDSPGQSGIIAFAGSNGNPQTFNIDRGVRFVDLNRDGLTDVLFSARGIEFAPFETFGGLGGVLLNRGAPDPQGAKHSAWCSSAPIPGVADCGGDASVYLPPIDFAWFDPPGIYKTSRNQRVVVADVVDFLIVDLNADGWPDLLTRDDDGSASRTSRAWIHHPGRPGSVWVEDDRFRPDQVRTFLNYAQDVTGEGIEVCVPCELNYSGYGFVDVNGDGVTDLIPSEPFWKNTHPAWISSPEAAQSDLLVGYANGRGHRVELDYASAIAQRDPSLEADAVAHALAPAEDDDPDNDFLAEPYASSGGVSASEYASHWIPRQVLASVRVRSPELEAPAETSYRYAHPRRCQAHQEWLGFRLVEAIGPDGSRTDTYRYQDHGRTGALSERIVYDANDAPMHYQVEDWEVVADGSVNGSYRAADAYPRPFDRSYVGRVLRSASRNEYGESVGDDPGFETATRTFYDDFYGYNFVDLTFFDLPGRASRTSITPEPADLDRHLVGRPRTVSVHANEPGDDGQVEWTTYRYVDAAGQPSFDKPGSIARLDAERRSLAGARLVTTGFVYDTRGNLVEERTYDSTDGTLSGDHRTTRYCYDGDPECPLGQGSRSMVAGIQDALGHWSWSEPHPVFAEPERSWSEYFDVPTLRATYDALGRPTAQWYEPFDGEAPVKLADHRYVDVPSGGLLFEGAPVSYRVSRRYAEAGDAAAVESIAVSAGGDPMLSISLVRSGEGGGARFIATATSRSSDPVGRVESVSEPFACDLGPAAMLSGSTVAYEAAIDACAGAASADPQFVSTEKDVLGRIVRVDTPLGFEVRSYSATLASAGEFGPPVPHDLEFHKNANGGLHQRVVAGGPVVEIRDCVTPMDPERATLTTVSCETPRVSRLLYEPNGELRVRVDPTVPAGGGSGPYAYGAEANQKLAYAYDTLGRVVEIDDPDAGRSTRIYDVQGDLVSTTDARGITVDTEYDALGRPIRVGVSGEPGETTYAYGRFTPFRNVTQVGDPDGVTWFGTDSLGRARTVASIVDGRFMRVRRTFDYLNRITRIAYPPVFAGRVNEIAYAFDGGLLDRVCDAGVAGGTCDDASAEAIVSGTEYDTLGRLVAMSLPGGDRRFTYDDDTQRLKSDHFDSAFTASNEDVAFDYVASSGGAPTAAAYDPMGNLTRVEAAIGEADFESIYTYDARNRIASWTWAGPSSPTETFGYDYDLRGNLVEREGATQDFASPSRAHALQSRAEDGSTWTYSYDAAGNLDARTGPNGTTRYRFDGRGRLTCVGSDASPCGTLEVQYNGLGQRVRETRIDSHWYLGSDFRLRTTPGGKRDAWIELYALGQRIGYKHVTGGTNARIELFPGVDFPEWFATVVVGLALVALLALLAWSAALGVPLRGVATMGLSLAVALFPIRAWAGWHPPGQSAGTEVFRWVMSDMIGTSTVEIDERGVVLGYSLPKPFGGVAAEAGGGGLDGRRFYAGHDRQEQTGLVYMNARWMDPSSGTFLSVDPIVRDAATAQTFNGYAYAANNPVSRIDPNGMLDIWYHVGSGGGGTPSDGAAVATGTTASSGGQGADDPIPSTGGNSDPDLNDAGGEGGDPGGEDVGATGLLDPAVLAQLHQIAKDSNASASVVVGGGATLAGFVSVTVNADGEVTLDVGVGVGVGEMSVVSLSAQGEIQGGEMGAARLDFMAAGASGGGGLLRSSVSISSPGASAGGGFLVGQGGFAFAGPAVSISLGNVSDLSSIDEMGRP